MQLYLDQIISSNSGTLQIALPSGEKIKAILTEDPTYSVQNNWGPILPGIQALSDISQMADNTNIIAFINASSAGWKGTEPLTISVQFILLNYKRGLNIKKQIKELAKMAALEQATNGGGARVIILYCAGYRDWETDRKSTRLNSSHSAKSRMPSSA